MNDRGSDTGGSRAETDRPDGDSRDRVVTAFLRHRGRILLLRRSDAVGTYRGQWGGVSGFAEGDPDGQVRREIEEETGLDPGTDVSLVRSSGPVRAVDEDLGREWAVRPYLFEVELESPEIELSEEHDALEWVPPTACLAFDLADGAERPDGVAPRETVPKLWEAYERVAPTVRSIAADGDHGAAWLSIRALEVLRDRAGLLVAERAEYGPDPAGERDELAELARRLLEARPSMAVLRNRVNRAMAGALDGGESDDELGAPAALESALEGIDRALEADERAAANAADLLEGGGDGGDGGASVMTISRSGTVLEALRRGDPSRVFVAESRPAREGIDVAEELADEDLAVTVHTDAAAAHLLAREDVDRVLVGADTLHPDGSVVNKTGTRALAVAAAREGIPLTVVAATDKVSTREAVNLESGDRSAVYDGDARLDVANPTFDVTPADCVTEVVTEAGPLEAEAVSAVAEELRDLESWTA
ncbi:NUDIX domain-containing protein [Natrialbaceae archaeon GCM10025810]|uniref:NUDIX domain-containing protein n=1 Tax=Halovalidus salilacus TaxID=3075124 RepID=UPI00361357C9